MSDTPLPSSQDAAALGPTPTGYQRSQGGTTFKWMPPSTEHLAKLLPQYQVEAIVGRGGMGAVYRGKQKTLDRTVAIKILPPEVDDEDASYTERFKNEAKIMARLEHPAIVPVYDFGETSEGQLYFVMGFVNGTDVHQMIQSQGRLPPEHALAITAHVCDALAYAHAHGVIHRDIKPSNVLINMDGQVKVADFGLAKVDDPSQSSGLTKTGLAMGTPDYVAPETLTVGVQADGRADLYAVGVMLYQMLTGNVPRGMFTMPSVMIGCDPRFDAIVAKAMKYDRDERYATAADLRRDLDIILTTPLVQAGGQSSAAIPQNALPPKPIAKGQQKPGPKPAATPAATASPESGIRNPKSGIWLGLGAAAAIAIAAFVMMGGKKEAASAAAPVSSPSQPPSNVPKPTSSPGKAETPSSTASSPTPTNLPGAYTSPKAASGGVSAPPKHKFPPGQWVKVFTQTEDLPEALRKAEKKAFFSHDGSLRLGPNKLPLPDNLSSNYAVRARFTYLSSGSRSTLVLRSDAEAKVACYEMRAIKNALVCQVRNGADVQTIAEKAIEGSLKVKEGQDYTLEFAVIGPRLIARYGLGGQVIVSCSNERLPNGGALIYGGEPIRDIEVINLDGIPEAEALKILGVDEKGNDLRGGSVAQRSAGIQPAPAPTPPSASKSMPPANPNTKATDSGAGRQPSGVLPNAKPVNLMFPLPMPKRPSLMGDVIVFRLDGQPLGSQDNEVLPPSSIHDAVAIAAFDTRSNDAASVHAVVLRASGTASAWGRDHAGDTKIPSSLTNIVAIAAAGSRSMTLTSDGKTQFHGTIAGRSLNLLKTSDVRVVALLNGEGYDNVQLDSGEVVSLRDPLNPLDKPLSDLGKLAAVARFGDVAAAILPDGTVVWVRGPAPKSEPFLRAPFVRFRLAISDGIWVAAAFDDDGPVGINPESKAPLFAGMTDVVTSRTVAMGRIGKDQWRVIGKPAGVDVTSCESQARGCVALAITERYVFGIKASTVVAAEKRQQQADTLAAIPELKTLHDAFVKLQSERVTAPFDADLAKLNTSYLGGLDREIVKEKQKGHLDGVLLLEAEKKLVASSGTRSSVAGQGINDTAQGAATSGDARLRVPLEATSAVPAEDNDQTPDNLKALRKTYRDAFTKLDTTRTTNLKALTDPLTIRLKQLESTLTQQNRIDHAKTVREYRESLTDPAAITTSEAPASADNSSTSEPPSKYTQREVAEWFLGIGAKVTVKAGAGGKEIKPGEKLPAGQIVILRITPVDTQVDRWSFTDEDFARLHGLRELTELSFAPSPGVTGSGIALMGTLPALTKLVINWPKVVASNFQSMPAFPKLTDLTIDPSICPPTEFEWLARFKQLTLFFASGAAMTDEHLAVVARCPKLVALRCSLAKLTDDGLSVLESARLLEELFIHNNSGITGTGLIHLKSLPKLKTLNTGGGPFEARNLSIISQLKHVTKLFLNGNTITKEPDECVRQLTSLRNQITELEIGYAKDVTDGQIAAIKKAMPKTTVTVKK